MSFDSFMDLHNAPLSQSAQLFLREALKKALERSSHVLYDEAIRKAVAMDEPKKRLQFSQAAHLAQSVKHSGLQSSRPASGKGTLVLSLSSPKTPPSSGEHKREKKVLEVSCPPLSHSGRYSWAMLESMEFLLGGGLDDEVLRSRCIISFHHLQPVSRELGKFPSYSSGSVKAQTLQGEVDIMMEKGSW